MSFSSASTWKVYLPRPPALYLSSAIEALGSGWVSLACMIVVSEEQVL